ncbi:MAG: hypothetical protein EBY36_10390, partial [Gammaproteobacteria bacterium]|nr:hypothetical protein [Gammaproteobacteria bacterium]
YHSACVGRSIALALVKGGAARQGATIYAQLMDGTAVPVAISGSVFYDPDHFKSKS